MTEENPGVELLSGVTKYVTQEPIQAVLAFRAAPRY